MLPLQVLHFIPCWHHSNFPQPRPLPKSLFTATHIRTHTYTLNTTKQCVQQQSLLSLHIFTFSHLHFTLFAQLLSTIVVIFALFNGHSYPFVFHPLQLVCMCVWWMQMFRDLSVRRNMWTNTIYLILFPPKKKQGKQQQQAQQCPQHVYNGFKQIKSLTMLTDWLGGKCLGGINSHSCVFEHHILSICPTVAFARLHSTQWRCAFLLLTHSTLKKHNFRQKSQQIVIKQKFLIYFSHPPSLHLLPLYCCLLGRFVLPSVCKISAKAT